MFEFFLLKVNSKSNATNLCAYLWETEEGLDPNNCKSEGGGGGGGGGLTLLPRSISYRFWSHLVCAEENANIFSCSCSFQ